MLLEEEGLELRGCCAVSVAANGAASSRAPHLLQNTLSRGETAEHDGQGLTGSPSETAIDWGRLL
jgi:hypothetical protein